MSFEKYEKPIEPRCSIRKNGQIALNSAMIKQFEIDENSYAHLFYDAEAKQIGIKIDEEKSKGARKLTIINDMAVISGMGFMKKFAIEPVTKARKFEPDFIDGMIILNLNYEGLPDIVCASCNTNIEAQVEADYNDITKGYEPFECSDCGCLLVIDFGEPTLKTSIA